MPTLPNVALRGLISVVPPTERRFADEAQRYGDNPAQIQRIQQVIGLDRRRVVAPGTTAADLAEVAARALLERLQLPAETIDGVLMVTQTPDHFQPGNALLLHGKLGLRKACAAFDVNLGCSGYVYGLWLAGQMIASGACRRVLLLVGDTLSRIVHPRDRSTAPLFGDAAAATLLEHDPDAAPLHVVFGSDGTGAGHLIQPAGAFREPASAATELEHTDTDGNTRRPRDLAMNGAEVFNFSLREAPAAVEAVLAEGGLSKEAVNAFVFHQANRYILHTLARKLGIAQAKVPAETVGRYGNSSSASIPVTLADALHEPLTTQPQTLVLCGFGVGLSWASALLQTTPLRTCALLNTR